MVSLAIVTTPLGWIKTAAQATVSAASTGVSAVKNAAVAAKKTYDTFGVAGKTVTFAVTASALGGVLYKVDRRIKAHRAAASKVGTGDDPEISGQDTRIPTMGGGGVGDD